MKKKFIWLLLFSGVLLVALFLTLPQFFYSSIYYQKGDLAFEDKKLLVLPLPPLDTLAYDQKLDELANNLPMPQPALPSLWPVKTVYPNAGALLPFKRVVAYYGNLYSKKMGVLGEYPEDEMLQKLNTEIEKWEAADPSTPVVPALHYIAVVAQEKGGTDGKYRLRMPETEIDKVLKMAEKINAIVFLDIQVGFSNLQKEVPLLEQYLKLPNVHLGVDAEFAMKGSIRPGKVVGTLDATDINFTADYLAKVVKENNLTPKILVVHRYTQKMITNYKMIKILPEVQIVMHMDGWGGAAKKMNTYQQFIHKEPVQFTGFKLFYKNDVLEPGTILMTPNDLLKLSPKPVYIQYQ
ncbi:hypothetical protein A3A05_01825 [Candidatus Nomurabacteria bacterium RIFCSPLOWO2_01_FULL_41_12]|uniref:Lipoprotein n=1 Tax=Candidatus Nomurabacteria bacterium RIFCSPLOWO2_01_FULL_41_12 TaxID=1801774 RepID=A0A1F6WWZ0_9BACT|nr:MAG: hypothetical protein A3A05_01825 [Candidatus Nomurabacteria bacterium RIFCSPLOWO2_01_FULL_41_12]